MIPFIDDVTREFHSKHFFNLIDESSFNDSEFDVTPDDLLLSLEDFDEFDCSDEDLGESIVGLDCFLSGCTEHCAKTHCSGLNLDPWTTEDEKVLFTEDVKEFIKQEEPVKEREIVPYTPHWDHCYHLTTPPPPPPAVVKEEPKEEVEEEEEEEKVDDEKDDYSSSENESEEEEEDDEEEEQQEANDDYYVDVESFPEPERRYKRPVGRPRIHHREPIDTLRHRQVIRINKAALKRSLPAPKNPRVPKRKRNSVESTPSSSDTEDFRPYESAYRNSVYRNSMSLVQRRYHAKQANLNSRMVVTPPLFNSPQKKPKGKRTKISQSRASTSNNNVKHNNAEKERRNIQRVALVALKDLLPIDKPNAPKVVILNTAAAVVTQLSKKDSKYERRKAKLQEKKKKLLARLRDLRVSLLA